VGPRAGLDRCEKSRPPPSGIRSPTVQPVASSYTDYATRPTHVMYTLQFKPWNKSTEMILGEHKASFVIADGFIG
jgi:hypothetical protein